MDEKVNGIKKKMCVYDVRLSALPNEEKLHRWLFVFVLATDRFLFLTAILPLNTEFLF